MQILDILIWKSAPTLRLLLPLIAGILLQFYYNIEWIIIAAIFILAITLFSIISLLSSSLKYSYNWLLSLSINLFFIPVGGGLINVNNTAHNKELIVNNYIDSSRVIAVIQEPLLEKSKILQNHCKSRNYYKPANKNT